MLPHKIRIFSLALILVIVVGSAVSARVRHVPDEYSTIQAGINDCGGGDTLLVHPGTYLERLNFNGQYLTLASLFLTTGDYSYVESTIIDGDGSGSVITVNHGEGRNAVVYGFTIQNGWAQEGGGFHISQSDPTIAYNIIRDNLARLIVGGGEGGGIFCFNGSPLIFNNVIFGNTTDGNYGGSGGGIYCDQATPVMINNTITRNTSNSLGGGIRCYRSEAIITNSILWNNYAIDEGDNIHITECSPEFSYCDVYAGWPGEGNINSNPEFRDPDGDDFHLMSTEYGYAYDSPCIDTGNPDIRDSRLESLWGLGTILSDMGAYGGGDSAGVGVHYDRLQIPNEISLTQNYPNPFNANTKIEFTITEPGYVNLRIYDILGREVKTLVSEHKQAGAYIMRFNAGEIPSGLYFYRLQVGNFAETKQMMLLK